MSHSLYDIPLQRLHAAYAGRGPTVLGFPCNDLAAQEPGTETDIGTFCDTQYGVDPALVSEVESALR
jgi:glutathione peroxidase